MKIAIIGAGFAGLATAWHLLVQNHSVTLFDAKGVGKGASGIAAGLLHPYVGKESKLTQDALIAMQDTQELLDIASETLAKPVYKKSGMLRLALDNDQRNDFFNCASQYKDVIWQDPFPPYPFPGILIKSALTVDCPLYLNGLFIACQKKGMQFFIQKIETGEELHEFDLLIFTTGAEKKFSLPLFPVKGQILTLKWPKNLPEPQMPVNSKAYLIMQENGLCLLGSTFEHTFASPLPDIEFAKSNLLPKMAPIFPELNEVVDCRAALRASTPNRKPYIEQMTKTSWLYAGLGSKGLLYHAHFAKKLIAKIG